MAYSSTSSNSDVSTDSNCSSSCLENVKILKEQNKQQLKDLRISKLNDITYKTCLESVEARLLVYKKNESVYEEDIKVLKCETHLREVAIIELRRKLDLAQKQKDEIQLIVKKFENSSNSSSKLIDCQIVDKCKTGLGYNVVPPPYIGNFMPPKPDLSFSGLEDFVNEPIVSEPTAKKHVVETSEAKMMLPRLDPVVLGLGPQKKCFSYLYAGNPHNGFKDQLTVIDSGCSRHITGNMSYLTDYEEIDGGYVAFGGNPKGGKITSRGGNMELDSRIEDESVFLRQKPALGFMRPFGCLVTILNTIDHLGKFDGKADEGFFVGLQKHVRNLMHCKSRIEVSALAKITIMLPCRLLIHHSSNFKEFSCAGFKPAINVVCGKISIELPDDPNMPPLEDSVYSDDDEDVGAEADMNNLDAFMPMDVKCAFLYGKIEEERLMFVQPPGILKIQIFLDRDDIIFGSTKKSLCTEFEKMMHKKFQMSFMGELTLFLGLQVKQKEDGIFISQDKYVTEILKKFSFTDVKTASTPMETQKLLLKDEDGEEVDVHLYRSMIGSLMYLTSSRPDIMFAVCACARYQVNPKVSHLHVVKIIFRYLKSQPKLCLWYPKDLPFDLVAYTNSDYSGESLDRNSTTGGFKQIVDFLNANPIRYALTINPTIYTSCIEQFWATVKVKTVNREVQLQALVDGKKIIIMSRIVEKRSSTRKMLVRPKRKDTEIPQSSGPTDNVADEAVNEEMDDNLERAATTAISLDAYQDMGNINKIQSKSKPNEPSSLGTSSGGGPRRPETMGDTIAQTRS
ncbi:uncharacterized mitochondrial protein-like protein [Tanacetum coccineum]